MDCRLFLDTARFLHSQGRNEADYRSAVSRAYYACFIEFSEVLFNVCECDWRAKGRRSQRQIRHAEVRDCLRGSSVLDLRNLGNDFGSLQTKRSNADYDMDSSFGEEDAEDAILLADGLLSDMSAVDPADIRQTARRFMSSL